MQNDRDPLSALLDFLGVTDFMNTLWAASPRDSESTISTDTDSPISRFDPPSESPSHLVPVPQSCDLATADQDLVTLNEESVATTAIAVPNLLPSESLTISVESVTVDICQDDPRDRDLRSPERVVLGEVSMSARYGSVYDSLIRNLARRKRQALADELGDLFDAIQDQGYTYADLLGAMREILATQTSGELWEDCLEDLDRAIDRALRAQSSEPEALTVTNDEDTAGRDTRDRPRLEPEKLDRDGRDVRDDRHDRKTWNDSPITS
ncbi:MAG: hypothetical protein EAZ61_05300 [Oscillatoriales cyanobacterium]|nr:MAG: hypothetical protein EAZ61_05300 [Oscillatoriales cyanobacterium]